MARNIEIKARAADFEAQLRIARDLADGDSTNLIQIDTFFNSPTGRLKLREFPDQDSQLIYYHRPDQSGPKLSDYHITHTPNAEALKITLRSTLGELATVKKVRTLLKCGRTRLHFDQVEKLGEFIELEVVLSDQEELHAAEQEAHNLLDTLKIAEHDLIDGAYVDLLLAKLG